MAQQAYPHPLAPGATRQRGVSPPRPARVPLPEPVACYFGRIVLVTARSWGLDDAVILRHVPVAAVPPQ